MGHVSTMRIFGKMKRRLTLIAVKVNALKREEEATFDQNLSRPERFAGLVRIGRIRSLTLRPVRVNARPALHLAPNTQIRRCNLRRARI